jgi:hypothetical protein
MLGHRILHIERIIDGDQHRRNSWGDKASRTRRQPATSTHGEKLYGPGVKPGNAA